MELSSVVTLSVWFWNQIDEGNFAEPEPQIMFFSPLYCISTWKTKGEIRQKSKGWRERDEERKELSFNYLSFHIASAGLF